MLIYNYSTDYLPLWRPRGQTMPLVTSNLVQRGGFVHVPPRSVWCGGLVMFDVSGSFASSLHCHSFDARRVCPSMWAEVLSLAISFDARRVCPSRYVVFLLMRRGFVPPCYVIYLWGEFVMLFFVWCARKFCPSLLQLFFFQCEEVFFDGRGGFIPRYVVFLQCVRVRTTRSCVWVKLGLL